jgi:hypothetical protein
MFLLLVAVVVVVFHLEQAVVQVVFSTQLHKQLQQHKL